MLLVVDLILSGQKIFLKLIEHFLGRFSELEVSLGLQPLIIGLQRALRILICLLRSNGASSFRDEFVFTN